MTDRVEVSRRVTDLIKQKFGAKLGAELTPDTPLFSSTGLSSVDAIELVVELEDEFGIFFDGDELDISELQTIESVVEIVRRLIAGQ